MLLITVTRLRLLFYFVFIPRWIWAHSEMLLVIDHYVWDWGYPNYTVPNSNDCVVMAASSKAAYSWQDVSCYEENDDYWYPTSYICERGEVDVKTTTPHYHTTTDIVETTTTSSPKNTTTDWNVGTSTYARK